MPSASQMQTRSALLSAIPLRIAAPYPCSDSKTSRAVVRASSSEVPGSALLLTTTMSSAIPNC